MFSSFIMLLLLVSADLHGEMGGGSGLLDGMYIDENCFVFFFFFPFFFLYGSFFVQPFELPI